MGVTIFTESKQQTCESSGAKEDLTNGRLRIAVTRVEWWGTRMEYATHRWFGGLGLKTIGGRFRGFRPQNPSGGSEEEQTTRGGIEEFASRRSYLTKGAVAVR
jgi:hypothetical protein